MSLGLHEAGLVCKGVDGGSQAGLGEGLAWCPGCCECMSSNRCKSCLGGVIIRAGCLGGVRQGTRVRWQYVKFVVLSYSCSCKTS